jgi:hypothetical protein
MANLLIFQEKHQNLSGATSFWVLKKDNQLLRVTPKSW